MKISERLRNLRTEKDLTQSQLAKIAGVSDKAVSAWELGTRDPKLKFIHNICVHFGIDINSFLDESSDTYQMASSTDIAPMKPLPLDYPPVPIQMSEVDNAEQMHLSEDECKLIQDYRGLNDQGQEYIQQTMYMAAQTYKKMPDLSNLGKQA